MSEIAKGLVSVWSLLAGWIFPVFLFVELAAITSAAVLDQEPFQSFFNRSLVDSQLSVLFLAAVLGFLFYAIQLPLYRVLEGYLIWPRFLKAWGLRRHRIKRQRLIAEADEAAENMTGRESAVWAGMRYAIEDLAPTTFGNAMRGIEGYASDRYRLDYMSLKQHLSASTPEPLMKAQNTARVTMDFGVCTAFAGSLLAAVSGVLWAAGEQSPLLVFVALGSALAAFGGYRIALHGTYEWGHTVRAQVDVGRRSLAAALGLEMPEHIEDERMMWSAVNIFVKVPYDRSPAGEFLDNFRTTKKTSEGSEGRPLGGQPQ